MSTILHIAHSTAWQRAQVLGVYRDDALETEGFIHCSLPAQVIPVADVLYKGRTGLVLLCIDEKKVTTEVRYEDCYETGQTFPHIYGPLNRDAIVAVRPLVRGNDGHFEAVRTG